MSRFTRFTKRTDDPKLSWLERALTDSGIPHQRSGSSAHAPILEVPEDRLGEAWSILTPVDDIADDDPMFVGYEPHDWYDADECDEYGEIRRAGLDRSGRP